MTKTDMSSGGKTESMVRLLREKDHMCTFAGMCARAARTYCESGGDDADPSYHVGLAEDYAHDVRESDDLDIAATNTILSARAALHVAFLSDIYGGVLNYELRRQLDHLTQLHEQEHTP